MELPSGLVRVASYRRKLPPKAKNIYLPTEVWVDVFCFPWTARKTMAQMVDKIGNRWFCDQLQFYLHEWGKHTLGELYFEQQGVCPRDNGQFLDYPQTAMPENIKFYKSLQIEHFDNHVYNFFRRIQRLLTADTKLDIGYIDAKDAEQVGNARTILGHLLPLIDGVHTLKLDMDDDQMQLLVKWCMGERFNQIKVLEVCLDRFVQSTMQPIMEWLTTSCKSNEPKLLELNCADDDIDRQVLETIRKQFMEAIEPSTFAVIFFYNNLFLDFNCENGIGQQLCGMRAENGESFEVFCHQANAEAGDQQLRQWVDENMEGVYNRKRCIRLSNPTIGPGRIFALPDLDETDEDEADNEEDEEKPSSSNNGRICE